MIFSTAIQERGLIIFVRFNFYESIYYMYLLSVGQQFMQYRAFKLQEENVIYLAFIQDRGLISFVKVPNGNKHIKFITYFVRWSGYKHIKVL